MSFDSHGDVNQRLVLRCNYNVRICTLRMICKTQLLFLNKINLRKTRNCTERLGGLMDVAKG